MAEKPEHSVSSDVPEESNPVDVPEDVQGDDRPMEYQPRGGPEESKTAGTGAEVDEVIDAIVIRFIPVDHNTLRERDIRFNRK